MALTTEEKADIRLVTGADDSAVISDAVIQAQYDLAVVDAADSSLTLPYTYVYILRRLWGYQRVMSDRQTDHGDNERRSQITENSKALLDYWEGQAGLGGVGRISSGVLQLGLDEDDE